MQPSPRLEQALVQYHWRTLAEWDAWRWQYTPVVVHAGRIVGTQDAGAEDFPVARSVSTAAWLGRAWQGRGLGREMREAILHLAYGLRPLDFDGTRRNHLATPLPTSGHSRTPPA